jgi:hypothetical protein
LLGNYSILHKSPARFLGAALGSGDRSNFSKSGSNRNWGWQAPPGGTGGVGDANLISLPTGQRPGGAWMLPIKAGKMVSRYLAEVSLVAAGNGALGRNMVGDSTISLLAAGLGGLIAGGVGSATITLNGSGAITATVSSPGSATISLSAAGSPGAIGWLTGDATIQIDGDVVSYGIGHMVGTTAESGLTPTGIANAVWAALATAINVPGTAGGLLNGAGSAGDPWVTPLPGAYAAGTAGDIIGNGTLTPAQLAILIDLFRVHGLVVGEPLVVTPTTRAAGALSQTIGTVLDTTTVTRV